MFRGVVEGWEAEMRNLQILAKYFYDFSKTERY